eukprot:360853-Chlamydomonas_euryale.AAC.10
MTTRWLSAGHTRQQGGYRQATHDTRVLDEACRREWLSATSDGLLPQHGCHQHSILGTGQHMRRGAGGWGWLGSKAGGNRPEWLGASACSQLREGVCRAVQRHSREQT